MPNAPTITMPDFKGSPITFLKEVKAELSKVIWPTKKDVVKLTIIVLVFSAAVGFYIGGLDFLFTSIMNIIVKR